MLVMQPLLSQGAAVIPRAAGRGGAAAHRQMGKARLWQLIVYVVHNQTKRPKTHAKAAKPLHKATCARPARWRRRRSSS